MKQKVWLYKDKATGLSKGEATVTYDDSNAAKSAITWFNGKDFRGTIITVQLATKKDNWSGGRGGGRGGGGGGRGGFGGGGGRGGPGGGRSRDGKRKLEIVVVLVYPPFRLQSYVEKKKRLVGFFCKKGGE